MNKIYLATIFLISVFMLSGQDRETRSLSSFTGISVGQAIEVEMVKGSTPQAIVEVDGMELKDVITEVYRDRLRIKLEDRRGGYRNADVRVVVTFQELKEIDVSSAADLYCQDVIAGESLEVSVSSAGDAKLRVDVRVLEVSVQSAGDLEIEGKAQKQYVNVSSSGDYEAYELESEEADVDVSSSGDVRINVSRMLEADASSSGTVYYRGNPEKIYVDSSSSGKVKRS